MSYYKRIDWQNVPEVLTTGQVAKLLKTSSQTIINWCDSGRLISARPYKNGYRRLDRKDVMQMLGVKLSVEKTLADHINELPAIYRIGNKDLIERSKVLKIVTQ